MTMTDFRLRPATLDDAALLFAWRTDPATVAASLGPPPTQAEHARWLQATLADPSRRLFVAEETLDEGDAPTPVGTGRIDVRPDEAELSITVAPHCRGCGHGIRLLARLVSIATRGAPGRPLVARVRGDNVASIKLFLGSGFVAVGAEGSILRLVRDHG